MKAAAHGLLDAFGVYDTVECKRLNSTNVTILLYRVQPSRNIVQLHHYKCKEIKITIKYLKAGRSKVFAVFHTYINALDASVQAKMICFISIYWSKRQSGIIAFFFF